MRATASDSLDMDMLRIRRDGHKALWGGQQPPKGSERQHGAAWRMMDDLSIVKKMLTQKCALAEIKAVILEPGQKPRTMKWYWQSGKRNRYHDVLHAIRKRGE